MEVVEILMDRDGLTIDEAIDEAKSMKQRMLDGESPDAVFGEKGIDPDVGILSLLCALGLSSM